MGGCGRGRECGRTRESAGEREWGDERVRENERECGRGPRTLVLIWIYL